MGRDIISLITEERENLAATEDGIRRGRDAYNSLQSVIDATRKRLSRRESPAWGESISKEIIKLLKNGDFLPALLIKEIDDAASGSKEFNDPVYLSPLYMVANNKDIYKLVTSGGGWAVSLIPVISFAEEAGKLEDYARGIRVYRASLKTKIVPGTSAGLKATNWWESRVYPTSLNATTVDGRIGASGRPAPFWQILNSGSQPLASDRPDESYNPFPQPPTGFITKAEEKIKEEFKRILGFEKVQWQGEVTYLKGEVERLISLRESFKADLKKMSTIRAVNRRVLDDLGKRASEADVNKLNKAIEAHLYGEGIRTSSIELTIPGAARRLRYAVRKLEGLI